MSWLIIFFGLIVVVLLTCISNGIAIIMNAVISKLTKRLKNAEIVQTIISVFIVICFLIVYYIFNVSLGNSPQLVESFINIPVIKWIVNIIAYYSITDLLILSLVCLVPFAVSVAIEVHGFNKRDVNKTSSQKEVEFKQKNITMHLFKNECSRYFRSNIYVLNTIIGAFFIFLLFFGVFWLFFYTLYDKLKT